jgi:hypothetical protein
MSMPPVLDAGDATGGRSDEEALATFEFHSSLGSRALFGAPGHE